MAYTDVDDYIANHADGLSNAAQYAKDQTKANYKFAFISAVIGTILGALVTMVNECIVLVYLHFRCL